MSNWEPGRRRGNQQAERFECFARDSWQCQRCGYLSPYRHGRDLNADHIHELARGGARTLANLQTLCVPCHDTKTRTMPRAGRRITRRPPIHPSDIARGNYV